MHWKGDIEDVTPFLWAFYYSSRFKFSHLSQFFAIFELSGHGIHFNKIFFELFQQFILCIIQVFFQNKFHFENILFICLMVCIQTIQMKKLRYFLWYFLGADSYSSIHGKLNALMRPAKVSFSFCEAVF